MIDNHLTEEAEIAERDQAWAKAATLWRQASEACTGQDEAARCRDAVGRCERQAEVDRFLADIARKVLKVPTLDTRKSDRLDFHEVAVWGLREALRLAYHAGRVAPG